MRMAAAAASSSDAAWSDLPGDILAMVASLLPSFVDLLRFHSVCRAWRDAAAACTPPLLPYLMFPDTADTLTHCFYSLSDRKVRRVKFPEEARHWRCCGSSHGWLAMAGLDSGVRLFNPLSGARLELPPLTSLPQAQQVVAGPGTEQCDGLRSGAFEDGGHARAWCVVDSEADGAPRGCTDESLRDDLVQKAVASPVSTPDASECTVMVLYGEHQVAYARPGDKSWTSLRNGLSSPCYEDLVYHEGKFYLLTREGAVWAADLAGGDPRMEEFAPTKEGFRRGGGRAYLSVARPSEELLLVCRRQSWRGSPARTSKQHFELFKLELGGEGRRWVEVESLGGSTVFLSSDCSMSVQCKSSRTQGSGGGCVPDSVYFREEEMEMEVYGGGGDRDLEMGIYHVRSRKVGRPFFAYCEKITQHPVWITPSL